MAYSIKQQGGRIDYNYQEIYVDTEAEVATVPTKGCSVGSVIFVVATGNVYVLNNAKEWVKV